MDDVLAIERVLAASANRFFIFDKGTQGHSRTRPNPGRARPHPAGVAGRWRHYEVLNIASHALRRRSRLTRRIRVAMAVLVALAAHFTETLIFVLGWLVAIDSDATSLSITDPTFADLI